MKSITLKISFSELDAKMLKQGYSFVSQDFSHISCSTKKSKFDRIYSKNDQSEVLQISLKPGDPLISIKGKDEIIESL